MSWDQDLGPLKVAPKTPFLACGFCWCRRLVPILQLISEHIGDHPTRSRGAPPPSSANRRADTSALLARKRYGRRQCTAAREDGAACLNEQWVESLSFARATKLEVNLRPPPRAEQRPRASARGKGYARPQKGTRKGWGHGRSKTRRPHSGFREH